MIERTRHRAAAIEYIQQASASLKFACETLGGVYIDHTICIEGKNLFGGK
jgi:hypothetical protein